jgi:ribonuclease Y
MSLFSIFKSGLFKTSKSISRPITQPTKPTSSAPQSTIDQPAETTPQASLAGDQRSTKPVSSVDTLAIIAQATATANSQAREIIISAKDEAFKIKDQAIKDAKIQLEEIEIKSKSLNQKQQVLVQEENSLKKQQQEIEKTKSQIEDLKSRISDQSDLMVKKLEKIASLTTEAAKKELLAQVEKKSSMEIARAIKEAEEKAKIESEDQAREILVEAMRAGATDYVAEYTISTIPIPD